MTNVQSFIFDFSTKFWEYFPSRLPSYRKTTSFIHFFLQSDEEKDIVSEYKSFLLNSRSIASSLSTNKDQNNYYLSWVQQFITDEIVELEFRKSITSGISRRGFDFSTQMILSPFLEILIDDSMPVKVKIQSIRTILSDILLIMEHQSLNDESTSIYTLLQQRQMFAKQLSTFFSLIKIFFNESPISEGEFMEVDRLMIKILQQQEFFLNRNKEQILGYNAEENEIWKKRDENNLQQIIKHKLGIPQGSLDLLKEELAKEYLITVSSGMKDLNLPKAQDFIKNIQKIRKQTIIPIIDLVSTSRKIIDDIGHLFSNLDLEQIKKPPIEIKLVPNNFSFLIHTILPINSNKTKRNQPAEVWFPTKAYYYGSFIFEIFTKIFPGKLTIFEYLIKNYPQHFVHQLFASAESTEALDLVLAFILSKHVATLEKFPKNEILSEVYLKILLLLKLAQIDLKITSKGYESVTNLKLELNQTFQLSELQIDMYFEKIRLIPGYYFVTYYLFSQFVKNYTMLLTTKTNEEAFKQIFDFIFQFYGAPPKLFLDRLATNTVEQH